MKRKKWASYSDSEDDEDYFNYDNGMEALDGEDAVLEKNQLDVVIKAREVRRELSSEVDFRSASLKPNHADLPLWVCANGQVYLETSSPDYELITEFIVAIAEPVSRPDLIHHYKVTPYSLYAAVSVDLTTDMILKVLRKFNKFETLSAEMERFIIKCTNSYGKAKLVLKNNKWLVESAFPKVLRSLLTNKWISEARIWPQDLAMDSRQGAGGRVVPQSRKNSFLSERRKSFTQIEVDKEKEEDPVEIKASEKYDMEKLITFQNKLDHALANRLAKVEAIEEEAEEEASEPVAKEESSSLKDSDDKFAKEGDDPKQRVAEMSQSPNNEGKEKIVFKFPKIKLPKPKALPKIRLKLGGATLGSLAEKKELDIDDQLVKKQLLEDGNENGTSGAHELGEGGDGNKAVASFEVDGDKLEQVKENSIKMNYPLMEEYDFRRDKRNPDLGVVLTAKLRHYQEKAMQKMFKNGRARSGLIVLPCGAGKTLTGITANCTINKASLVLCSSAVAVEQWIRSYLNFTSCSESTIVRFTKDSKQNLNADGKNILVTTYFMMSYSKKRNIDSARVINQIKNTEWGLLIMDEVHVVPAKMFRKAMVNVKAHCKLGLTATLVREDDLIDDLNFLIGPKLYEANWMKLTSMGFLARVLCAEVWCPMTSEFYKEYLFEKNAKRRQLLYVMNPFKFAMAKLLMEYHERQGDKVLLFSDNIPALLQYGKKLKRYFMYGNTPEREREWLLARFRLPANCPENSSAMRGLREKYGHLFADNFTPINTLIISQVGDVAIDLPEANIIIQISSHFGSRRQETQRLGRILRPKSGTRFKIGFNAFFYSLLSMDTTEMYYSNKRQQYLVDQGYTFKVIQNLPEIARVEMGLKYEIPSKEEQRETLRKLTTAVSNQDEDLNVGIEDLDYRFDTRQNASRSKKVKRLGTNPLLRKLNRTR